MPWSDGGYIPSNAIDRKLGGKVPGITKHWTKVSESLIVEMRQEHLRTML